MVEDWYAEGYYEQREGSNPHGPASGPVRALRVGSGTAVRVGPCILPYWWFEPDGRYGLIGFRCAADQHGEVKPVLGVGPRSSAAMKSCYFDPDI